MKKNIFLLLLIFISLVLSAETFTYTPNFPEIYTSREVEQQPMSHLKVEKNEYIKYENINSNLIKDFNLKIGKGEIVGLAGMISSGVSEIAEALYGINLTSGVVTLDGKVLKNNMYFLKGQSKS